MFNRKKLKKFINLKQIVVDVVAENVSTCNYCTKCFLSDPNVFNDLSNKKFIFNLYLSTTRQKVDISRSMKNSQVVAALWKKIRDLNIFVWDDENNKYQEYL